MKRQKILSMIGILAFLLVMGNGPPIMAYGYECPDVPSQESVGYPYLPGDQRAWVVKECYYSQVVVYPIRPAIRRETPIAQGASVTAYPGEMVKLSETGQASGVSSNNCYFARSNQTHQISDSGGNDGNNRSVINPYAWEVPFWYFCPGAPGSPPYTAQPPAQQPPPPGYPPPPSQPSATAGWTYQFGQNVGAGWTSITASANEIVAVTTGPATHRGHSFPGGVDRGTILIFVGAVNDSVYLPFGGWVGRYTSPNPSGAWPSLLDDKISAMRRWDNCSTGYGCRWLDLLVVGSGGYTIIYGPVLRGPYY